MESISIQEGPLRLLCFFSFIIIFMIYEFIFPFYKRTEKTFLRWITNFLFIIFDTLILRLSFPILAAGMASICADRGFGVLNNLSLSFWPSLIIAIILLDLGIWVQHFVFHRYNIFWRFHKIHHSDEEVDFSTGIRFHPIEIIVSIFFKFFFIFIIGPSVLMVIIFEVILNGSSIFNHSNIYIPRSFELLIRKIIVTPSMHRIHHSMSPRETNSNYGFNFSFWDRLFNTYCHESVEKEKDLKLGLEEFSKLEKKGFIKLMLIPFFNK